MSNQDQILSDGDEETKTQDQTSQVEETPSSMLYATKNAPQFKITGFFPDKPGKEADLVLKNGTVQLTDPKDIKRLDDLIAKKPSIAANIRKVDRRDALRIAQNFLSEEQKQTSGTKGGATAEKMFEVRQQALQLRDEELKRQGVNPENIDSPEIPSESFMPTVQATTGVDTPSEGFVAIPGKTISKKVIKQP